MADIERNTSLLHIENIPEKYNSKDSMFNGKVPEDDQESAPVVNDSRQCQSVLLVPEVVCDDIDTCKVAKGTLDGLGENSEPTESEQASPAKPWSELSASEKAKTVILGWIGKPLAVLILLYLFICSLNLLSSAFRLVGGKAAGNAFSSNVLIQNPVAGLMIGILSTVLVQSSSTSTSIVVAMVSSGILGVRPAIPIIMGANIGTSVTNTIVSLAQSSDRGQFELAFAGATVHDMFNWLAVIVLLPVEICTGFLYHLSNVLIETGNFTTMEGGKKDILKAITKPLTKLVVQLDKNVIEKLALGHTEYQNKSLLKQWCKYEETLTPVEDVNVTDEALIPSNETSAGYDILINGTGYLLQKQPLEECNYLFKMIPLGDLFLGLILMAVSLTMLCTCLVLVVKILNSSLKGPVSKLARKVINKDFPGKCSYFTGYLAIIAGACLTIVVQSSSVFTSTLTPLVGLNVITLERMYPLTLGSNIGTTTTGMLAAMAASGDKLDAALQIALVHLFFNVSGILIFYPIPFMRFPIPLAKLMGRTTAKYRWFAVFYLVAMFFLLPGCLFALSIAGPLTFTIVGCIALAFVIFLIIVNVMAKKFKKRLSKGAQKFIECLPTAFFSLQPMDTILQGFVKKIKNIFQCCCKKSRKVEFAVESDEPMLTASSNNSFRHNDSFYDKMTEEERINYESTVRSLEEVKIMLTTDHYKPMTTTDTDSGYVTQVHTPYLSKYPSKEDFSDL